MTNEFEKRGTTASIKPVNVNGVYGTTFNFNPNTDSGYVEITKLDQDKRIIAGRFAYTATSDKGEKAIVSDGRFDLVYLITD